MFNRMCDRRQNFAGMQMQDGMIDIDNNSGNIDIDFNQAQTQAMENNYAAPQTFGVTQQPIIEPMQERVVNRVIEHNVPQE